MVRDYSPIYILLSVFALAGIILLILIGAQARFLPVYGEQTNSSLNWNKNLGNSSANVSDNNSQANAQNNSQITLPNNSQNSQAETIRENSREANSRQTNSETARQEEESSQDSNATEQIPVIIPVIPSANTTQSTNANPDTYSLEVLIHQKINEQRALNGLSPIAFDNRLSNIARSHSEDMLARNYFSHTSPEGNDFSKRYKDAGYSCQIEAGQTIYLGGENLFTGYTYSSIRYVNGVEVSRDYLTNEELASEIVNGWMNSPGHRANILAPYWQNEGIGVAISESGKVMVTENFC